MDWYDRAEEYDILYGWDPARERDFLLGASERWGIARPRRLLEPFCGPGRLLRAMPGWAVGFDTNAHMVRYAARTCRVFRADASAFAVRAGCFDLAFCLIDSFRHLLSEREARDHLQAVAWALRPGAVYVVGFEVTGDLEVGHSADEWSGERDGVRVQGKVSCLGDRDPDSRIETMRARLEVERDGATETIESFQPVRVYAREDVQELVDLEGSFEIVAAFDRGCDLANPVELDEISGSAVLVLRR